MQIKKLILLILLVCIITGCATPARRATLISRLPIYLTSKEQMWTIPAGTPFKAIQKPAHPKLTEFIVGDADLAVLYKGNLMELEQEANRRVVKASRTGRKQGALLGIVGSVLSIASALIVKNKRKKK